MCIHKQTSPLKHLMQGRFYLNRDPLYFSYKLDYLRNDCTLPANLPHENEREMARIRQEFDYFCIAGVYPPTKTWAEQLRDGEYTVCRLEVENVSDSEEEGGEGEEGGGGGSTLVLGETALSYDGTYVAATYARRSLDDSDTYLFYLVYVWDLTNTGEGGAEDYCLDSYSHEAKGFASHGNEVSYLVHDRIHVCDMERIVSGEGPDSAVGRIVMGKERLGTMRGQSMNGDLVTSLSRTHIAVMGEGTGVIMVWDRATGQCVRTLSGLSCSFLRGTLFIHARRNSTEIHVLNLIAPESAPPVKSFSGVQWGGLLRKPGSEAIVPFSFDFMPNKFERSSSLAFSVLDYNAGVKVCDRRVPLFTSQRRRTPRMCFSLRATQCVFLMSPLVLSMSTTANTRVTGVTTAAITPPRKCTLRALTSAVAR